jgi:hypothetical protein
LNSVLVVEVEGPTIVLPEKSLYSVAGSEDA